MGTSTLVGVLHGDITMRIETNNKKDKKLPVSSNVANWGFPLLCLIARGYVADKKKKYSIQYPKCVAY